MIKLEEIQSRIYNIRNTQVMLDEDLALLYGVETKVLNQAIKRNSERFPPRFMFQITNDEFDRLRSQTVTSNRRGGRRYLPTIDNKDVFHFGASLKDLGKKWFAFSKLEKDAFRLMERLEGK